METRKAPFFNKEDRISRLPESLINHIFSFLETKYAVQTSVLSRRWRYFWKSLPTLKFKSSLFTSPTTEQSDALVDFIDRVLILRDSSDIQRFNLFCHYDLECDIETHLYTWLLAVVNRNIQELSVEIADNQMFKFPPSLFTCQSLTKLELKMSGNNYGDIILPHAMYLPRLKYLKLDGLSCENEKLSHKLLASCPLLESLIIIDTCINLNIYSLKLEHFKLEYSYICQFNGGVKTIKLYAPNLTSFSCKDFMCQDYTLENLSSLVTADINMVILEEEAQVSGTYLEISAAMKELYAQHMMKLLSALRNVKVLTLSTRFIEVLSEAPDLLESQPPQFCNLQCLKLETWLSKDCFNVITYLLNISPNIESLSLVIRDEKRFSDPQLYPSCDELNFNSESVEAYWEGGLSLPCMLYHLKYVEIQGVQGCINELKFLESLLKATLVLEKMVLCSSTYGQYSRQKERRLTKFSEKLLTFPKASASIYILFRF